MENFHKYTKIRPIGYDENKDLLSDPEDVLYIEEKIDGGNFRFIIKDGKVIIGSRSQQLTDNEGEDTNMNKMFKRCSDFVREKISKLDSNDLKMCEHLIFYGENCVRHTMPYDWERIPPFLGFDVYDLKNDCWYNYEDKLNVFRMLNLPMVPLIEKTTVKELKNIDDDFVPNSQYACTHSVCKKAEGIVIKNYSKQIFAKYVRDEFKEKNSQTFGGTPKLNKEEHNDNNIVLFKYCTNPRIEKMILKLVDEDLPLEMSMMQHLPKRVWEDVAEEEWQEIIMSGWIVDFGKLKKQMTKRCLSVLKQIITNNALNEKGEGK